jgi:hypothetical protein
VHSVRGDFQHHALQSLGRFENLRERDEVTVRKHISVNKRSGWNCGGAGARNPVIEKDTTGSHQSMHGTEIRPKIPKAYVLEHTHARDLVERMSNLARLAVVTQFHCATVSPIGLRDPALCYLFLFSTDRNTLSMHVVFASGVHH